MVTLAAGQPVPTSPGYVVEVGGTYTLDQLVPCRLATDPPGLATCQFLGVEFAGD
jgi:hypothetical protein